MAVYLGSAGALQLERSGEGAISSGLTAGDVDVTARRFSFSFPNGAFITGDRVSIRRVTDDGKPSTEPLDFIDNSGWEHNQQLSDGVWYVSADAMGGLMLFHTWAAALRGTPSLAVELHAPSTGYKIAVSIASGAGVRYLAGMTSYELSTSRESIDVTALGQGFVERTSGLISGNGSIQCFWDWHNAGCDDVPSTAELAHYVHQLVIRQEMGSRFRGVFYLKAEGATPLTGALSEELRNTVLFYAADCLVTEVGMAFEPAEPIRSRIEFVTVGPIHLLYSAPEDFLLHHLGDPIELEAGDGAVKLES